MFAQYAKACADSYTNDRLNCEWTQDDIEKLNLRIFQQYGKELGVKDFDKIDRTGLTREYVPPYMRENIWEKPRYNESRPNPFGFEDGGNEDLLGPSNPKFPGGEGPSLSDFTDGSPTLLSSDTSPLNSLSDSSVDSNWTKPSIFDHINQKTSFDPRILPGGSIVSSYEDHCMALAQSKEIYCSSISMLELDSTLECETNEICLQIQTSNCSNSLLPEMNHDVSVLTNLGLPMCPVSTPSEICPIESMGSFEQMVLGFNDTLAYFLLYKCLFQ